MKKIQSDLLAMNVSWSIEDLELYDGQYGFSESFCFTVARLVTLIMAIFVHRAFYKLMKRLPGRAVNQIIYPSMVRFQFFYQKLVSRNTYMRHFQCSKLYFANFSVFFCHSSVYLVPFSSDFDLLMYGTSFIVPLTCLLGVSHEKYPWRIRLLYFAPLEDYGNFCNTTSIFFHGYLSLHLPCT